MIANSDQWETDYSTGVGTVGMFAAKYPGVIGNNLKVSIADAATYSRQLTGTVQLIDNSNVLQGTGTLFTDEVQVGDILTFAATGSNVTVGGSTLALTVVSITDDDTLIMSDVTGVNLSGATVYAKWEYADQFSGAPIDSDNAVAASSTGDGLHIVIVDATGKISGTVGKVIEAYENISKASNAKKYDGTAAYYKNVLRDSTYLWWMDHPVAGDVTSTGLDFGDKTLPGSFKNLTRPLTYTLSGGANGYGATDGELETAFGIFADDQKYDVSLIMTGKASVTLANYVIQSVAEVRRDCVAFVSPINVNDNSVIIGDTSASIDKLVAYRNRLSGSSYAVCDNGFKYQYDKYNDVYRYIPLNGDIAGCTARSINDKNEWASPAGYNRGSIKNVTRLAVNPNKSQRDVLFQKSINFVVSFPSSGPILFSDKTMLDRPSDFDAIGIRLLFILLEKSIASSAKYFLFEQNTDLTRKLFVSMITPLLRDIQGKGGISDFYVDVSTSTVNTASVIQSKTFAANIYIKATKSIRFIKLNFIATPEGVSFSELTGQ